MEMAMKRTTVLLMAAMMATLASNGIAQTANPNWQKTWDETLAAAKKEGKVVVTGPPDAAVRKALPAAFKARYGITMEYLGAPASEMGAKMRVERSAGVYTIDAAVTGAQTMYTVLYNEKLIDPLKPALILPEVTDPAKWKGGKLWFMDPEQQYILRLINITSTLFDINTRLVKPNEIRSTSDLLDPKWRGKIAMMDPTVSGAGGSMAAQLYAQKGEDFVKRLYIDQKPMIIRDRRQLTDWLTRGTYPIVFNADDEMVEIRRKEGDPLVTVYALSDLPPSTTGGSGMLALIKNAPHPNAAKVFVNWMASKEGLDTYARARGLATARTDIDEKSFLPAALIPRPDVKYFDAHEWDFSVKTATKVRVWIKGLLTSGQAQAQAQ
jgi:iron(III) transport system substrate-binding protein